MATVVLPNVSATNLEKIESFINDSTYKEALESSANYNTRLCIERRMRLPFLDSQTGVAQNHSSLFMNKRQRMPGLIPGQIYTYPRQRWRKKRRQYLSMNARAFGRAVDHLMDEGDIHSISQVENPALQDTDSKDSQLLLKDEVSKDWYYDEQDMLEMEAYDEPDPDSDLDYEESYSKRNKKRRGTGRGRGGVDSPGTPGRRKGGGRGRKKTSLHNFDPTPGDPDKPFACELCGARYKTRPGLTYHYAHSHKEGASDENSREAPPPQMGMGVPSPMSTMGGVLGGGGPPPLVNGPPSLVGGGPPPPLVGGSGGPPPMVGGPPHPGIMPNLIGPPMPPHMAGQMPSGGGLLGPPPGNIGEVLPAGAAPGNVYQDSYVSFLNHPAGTPGRRGRQPANPPQLPPTQAPPTLPPNLPAPVPPTIDDPPMPVLVPEKTIETPPPILSAAQVQEGKPKAAPSPYCDFCLGDSAENKKTGGSEELVSCSDCGRSGKGKIDEKPKKGRKKK